MGLEKHEILKLELKLKLLQVAKKQNVSLYEVTKVCAEKIKKWNLNKKLRS